MTLTKGDRTRPSPAEQPADRELSQAELESISGTGGDKKGPSDPGHPEKKPG